MPLLQYLIPRACKQGINSKAGAIKCCKEIKITAPPNEWHNIPFWTSMFEVRSTQMLVKICKWSLRWKHGAGAATLKKAIPQSNNNFLSNVKKSFILLIITCKMTNFFSCSYYLKKESGKTSTFFNLFATSKHSNFLCLKKMTQRLDHYMWLILIVLLLYEKLLNLFGQPHQSVIILILKAMCTTTFPVKFRQTQKNSSSLLITFTVSWEGWNREHYKVQETVFFYILTQHYVHSTLYEFLSINTC